MFAMRSRLARSSFSSDCCECDGGAMDRPCLACGGRCGARSLRSIHDSQDERVGVWAVKCAFWPLGKPFARR